VTEVLVAIGEVVVEVLVVLVVGDVVDEEPATITVCANTPLPRIVITNR